MNSPNTAKRPGPHREPVTSTEPIRIGVSTCLLGEQVRFDGGHKRDAFLVETDQLDDAARRELLELIEDYGRGLSPLVIPLTLVRH